MLKKYKTSKKSNLTFLKVDPIFNNIVLEFYLSKLTKNGNKNIVESALYKQTSLINYLLKYSNILFLFFNLIKFLNISFIFLTKRLHSSIQKVPTLLNFTSAINITLKNLVSLMRSTAAASSLLPVKSLFLKIILYLVNIVAKGSVFKSSLLTTKVLLASKKYIHYRW